MPKAEALLQTRQEGDRGQRMQRRTADGRRTLSALDHATSIHSPQITVLDAGGQYCHLIARKVRELGVYAEVRAQRDARRGARRAPRASSSPAALRSVYDPGSPTVDPAIFALGHAGARHLLRPAVDGAPAGRRGAQGRQGRIRPGARWSCDDATDAAVRRHLAGPQQVWMSHRDLVAELPAGLSTSWHAPKPARSRPWPRPRAGSMACSFIPRWCTPRAASEILVELSSSTSAAARRTGTRADRVPLIEEEIRARAGRPQRLLLRQRRRGFHAWPSRCACARWAPERVRGIYVDTGLMREGETEFVRPHVRRAGRGHVRRRARRRAVPGRARGRDRSGAEAPHHRRGVRAGAGAHPRIARTCSTGTGFWDRARSIPTRSNPAARPRPRHQDASQSRGRDSEADRGAGASWSR